MSTGLSVTRSCVTVYAIARKGDIGRSWFPRLRARDRASALLEYRSGDMAKPGDVLYELPPGAVYWEPKRFSQIDWGYPGVIPIFKCKKDQSQV
jgi:hypothetical protein